MKCVFSTNQVIVLCIWNLWRDKLHSLSNGFPMIDSSHVESLQSSWYNYLLTQSHLKVTMVVKQCEWMSLNLYCFQWKQDSSAAEVRMTRSYGYLLPSFTCCDSLKCVICELLAQICFLISTDTIHPCRCHSRCFIT